MKFIGVLLLATVAIEVATATLWPGYGYGAHSLGAAATGYNPYGAAAYNPYGAAAYNPYAAAANPYSGLLCRKLKKCALKKALWDKILCKKALIARKCLCKYGCV